MVVSPNYPTDPFVAVVFTTQSFGVGVSNGAVNTNTNGIAWSTNSGASWATTLTGTNGAPFSSIDLLTVALSADFNWTNSLGTLAIGGQWESGAGSCVQGAACATTVYQANVSALRVSPNGSSFLGITDQTQPAAVTAATLDIAYTYSTDPIALARVVHTGIKTYGQVRAATGWSTFSVADEILDGGTTSFNAGVCPGCLQGHLQQRR